MTGIRGKRSEVRGKREALTETISGRRLNDDSGLDSGCNRIKAAGSFFPCSQ